MNSNAEILQAIRAQMDVRHQTNADMAVALGFSEKHIDNIFNGEIYLALPELIEVCNYLKLNIRLLK